jgi:CelD/BcsL family acetyltransferase involved in cellulose biosynthesis
VRRLGLIGDREVGSEYLGLVTRAGVEKEVGRAVMAHLATEKLAWDVADLFGLVEGDPAGAALEAGMRTHANRIRSERIPCSIIPLPREFDTYLAGLGSKFRQSYRQRANKLQRTCSVSFFKTESEGELLRHLEALYRMHQARWASAGYVGSFADARVRRFYLEVSRRLLEAGQLRFWHLKVDGVIRASQFGFAFNGVLHSLQEGYDTGFRLPGVGGLGVVLRGHVLRSSIEEGLNAYDFLAGTEDFKTRWGTSTHYVRSVRMASPGLGGMLGWVATVRAEDLWAALKVMVPDRLIRILRVVRLRRSRACGSWSTGDSG